MWRGRFQLALEEFEQSLDSGIWEGPTIEGNGPMEDEVRLALTRERSYLLVLLGCYDEAVVAAREVMAGQERIEASLPSEAEAVNSLAYALALAGTDLDEALQLAERAVALSPSEPHLGTLGAVLVQLGRYEEGIRILERTLKGAPTLPDRFETYRFLAMGYKASGMYSDGEECAALAIETCPYLAWRVDLSRGGGSG